MTKRSTAIYNAKSAFAVRNMTGKGNPNLTAFDAAPGKRRFKWVDANGYIVILKHASDYRETGGAVDATLTKQANANPETVATPEQQERAAKVEARNGNPTTPTAPMKGETMEHKWKAVFLNEGQTTEFNLETTGDVKDAITEAQAMGLSEHYNGFEIVDRETGETVFDADFVQYEAPKGETVEFEMTWKAASGIIAAGLENGTFEGVKMGRQELAKMAVAADQAVTLQKELQTAQAALETAQGRIERYEQENRDRMSDRKLWQEAKGLAQEIANAFRDELASDETLHDKEDEMRERAWETADGSQYVIYTHHALSICANCNTDNGEALLEELGMGENVTFDGLATRIAFGELYERINSELADILESEDE